jgi:hypothetical protein
MSPQKVLWLYKHHILVIGTFWGILGGRIWNTVILVAYILQISKSSYKQEWSKMQTRRKWEKGRLNWMTDAVSVAFFCRKISNVWSLHLHYISFIDKMSLIWFRHQTKAKYILAKFSAISQTITPAISCHIYLPWPIEMILSVSCYPRWPRQVQLHVAVANGFANKCHQCKWSIKNNLTADGILLPSWVARISWVSGRWHCAECQINNKNFVSGVPIF